MSTHPVPQWVPSTCTLPTEDQPFRTAEFDALLRDDLVSLSPVPPQRLLLKLRDHPDVAARAASLAVRETRCCSFFTFEILVTEGGVTMVVSTDGTHERVLATLYDRATASIGAGA